MYRSSFSRGQIPAPLKCGKLVPRFNGGSGGLQGNYRPISLTSYIFKSLERIIAKHITTFLEENKCMNQHQHGFCTGHSCLSQLLAHHEKILKDMELGINGNVIYLDFAKVFDRIVHGLLFHKVRDLDICRFLARGFTLSSPIVFRLVPPAGPLPHPLLF